MMKPNAALAFVLATICCTTAVAVPTYRIVPLGLTDLEHTRDDGYKLSFAQALNETGKVIGFSLIFEGDFAVLGFSGWLYDGSTTRPIGLTGDEFTSADGSQLSSPSTMNEAGQVIGISQRNSGIDYSSWLYDGTKTVETGLSGGEHSPDYQYSTNKQYLNEAGQVWGQSYLRIGGTYVGNTAWFYNGTTTLALGLMNADHTHADGYSLSSLLGWNVAGQIAGNSTRFNGGSTAIGTTAWLFDGTATRALGLTDEEHTRDDGATSSSISNTRDRAVPNEAGHVIGYSRRYKHDGSEWGQSAWVYEGAATKLIGLTGSEHTRADGYKSSIAVSLNQAGQVSGISERFNGGDSDLGRSAWVYNGSHTFEIGLTGSEHTRSDGYKSSSLSAQNEAGQVSGISERFNGRNTDQGRNAWIYDGTTTRDIGLTGSEHTSADGYKYNYPVQLNEAGQVIGSSIQYLGGRTPQGSSGWFYDGTTTHQIGLTSSEHTREDGSQSINADSLFLNELGQATGTSSRYNGDSTYLGKDAWFYDLSLDQTFALRLSTRSDGYAFSEVRYLDDHGLALGIYTLFDAFDNDLGNRAFYFAIADGLHDLGSLVQGGLPANGWDWLEHVSSANRQGQILGDGWLNSPDGSYSAFLLTPIVPEPTCMTLALFAIATCSFINRKPRQRLFT
jgi:hypothetical protein